MVCDIIKTYLKSKGIGSWPPELKEVKHFFYLPPLLSFNSY